MPQRYDTILPLDLSPIAFLSKTGDKSEREVISSHLAYLNFSHDEMNHAISDLSGGQKGKTSPTAPGLRKALSSLS